MVMSIVDGQPINEERYEITFMLPLNWDTWEGIVGLDWWIECKKAKKKQRDSSCLVTTHIKRRGGESPLDLELHKINLDIIRLKLECLGFNCSYFQNWGVQLTTNKIKGRN